MTENNGKSDQDNQLILNLLQQTQTFITELQQTLSSFQKKVQQKKDQHNRRRMKPESANFSFEQLRRQLKEKPPRGNKEKTNKKGGGSRTNKNKIETEIPIINIDPTIYLADPLVQQGQINPQQKIDNLDFTLPMDLECTFEDQDFLFLDDQAPRVETYPHYPQQFFEQELKRITKIEPKSTFNDVQKFAEMRWKEMTLDQRQIWCKPAKQKTSSQKKIDDVKANSTNFDTFLANKLNKTRQNITKQPQKDRIENNEQKEELKQQKIQVKQLVEQLKKEKEGQMTKQGSKPLFLEEQRLKRIFDSYGL